MLYAFIKENGLINHTIETLPGSYIISNSYDGFTCVDGEAILNTDIATVYFKEGWYLLPTKPSEYHLWDIASETWQVTSDSLTQAKTRTLLSINKVRNTLSVQPIEYDNKALDADTQAQANINGKLQEIFAREAINSPLTLEEMFWKDANNVIHSWTSQNDYKLWLQGLVIAISSRNTSLYATAWSKKAEVEALTDINDIINYDVSTGW